MHLYQFIVGLLLISFFARGQSFENIRASQEGSRMIVIYDLVSERSNATYTVALYSSHNNFSQPVQRVSGDVGNGQKPGLNKRVEWDLRTELQEFRGQITIELAGSLDLIKLGFRTPFISKHPRQGKTSRIEWVGATQHPTVKIELFHNGQPLSLIGDQKNSGSYDWQIPKDIKKGPGYKIRLTTGDEHIESVEFSIGSRVPVYALIAPAAAVVAVATWLLLKEDELPPAPDPN
jgi:hypothetical protein